MNDRADKPFDPLDAIAQMRARERPKAGPKLSRAEQCGLRLW